MAVLHKTVHVIKLHRNTHRDTRVPVKLVKFVDCTQCQSPSFVQDATSVHRAFLNYFLKLPMNLLLFKNKKYVKKNWRK